MVADLCHFVFSPRKAKGEDTKTCLFVVTSTFAFRGEDTKTRQTKGDNTKDFYQPIWNFQQRNFRAFAYFRLAYFVSSCLRAESRNNDKKTSHFAVRDEDTKIRNGINQPPYFQVFLSDRPEVFAKIGENRYFFGEEMGPYISAPK